MTSPPLALGLRAVAEPSALPRTQGQGLLLTAALALYTILLLTLSPFALAMLGFDYSDTGGTILTKFHPSTPLLCLVVVLAAAGTGNPLGAMVQWLTDTPTAFALGAATLIAAGHAALISQTPFTPVIETLSLIHI